MVLHGITKTKTSKILNFSLSSHGHVLDWTKGLGGKELLK